MVDLVRRQPLMWVRIALGCALGASAAWAATSDELYGRGLKAYLDGDYQTAASDLQQALQADPGHTQAKELLQLVQEVQQGQPRAGVLSQLTGALESQQSENARLKSVLANSEQRLSQLAAQQQEDQRMILALQGEVTLAGQTLSDTETRHARAMDQAAFQVQALEERGAKLAAQVEALGKDRASLSTQLLQATEELSRVGAELGQVELSRKALDQRVAQQAKEAEQQGLDQARLTQQAGQTAEELLRVKSQHEQLLAHNGLLESKVAQLDNEVSAREQERAALRQQLAGVESALHDAKTEIGQLSTVRNDNDLLKRTLGKTEAELAQASDDRGRLKDEVAALKKQVGHEARLRKDVDDLSARMAQRDEQLEKIRQINATLDQQFADTEVSQRQLEEKLRLAEQERNALGRSLAETQDALKAAKERSKSELSALQSSFQQQQGELTREFDELTARHDQTVRELEALHSTQIALQERLVAAREKNVSLDASLAGLQESKIAMDKLVKDRDAEAGVLRKTSGDVQEALRLSEKELLETRERLVDAEMDRKNLQEQIRIAKETQVTFNAQLRDLQAIQNDRDKLQVALNERETRLAKLQGELASLNRDYDTTKRQLQVQEAEGYEQLEQTKIDQKGLEWRVESLEREAEEARALETKARIELAEQTRKLSELETFKHQLANSLQQREEQLRQAESVIRMMQGGGSAPAGGPAAYIDLEPGPEPGASPETALDPIPQRAQEPVIPQTLGAEYRVKVYQVNDEFHFVVFSMEDEDTTWAKHGTQLLLVSEDQPVAAVELTELDSAGFAVAQIIQTIDSGRQLQKGDLLFARPLASRIGQ